MKPRLISAWEMVKAAALLLLGAGVLFGLLLATLLWLNGWVAFDDFLLIGGVVLLAFLVSFAAGISDRFADTPFSIGFRQMASEAVAWLVSSRKIALWLAALALLFSGYHAANGVPESPIFYVILRWVVCYAFLYAAIDFWQHNNRVASGIAITIATLFNPLYWFTLSIRTWRWIDFACGATALAWAAMQSVHPSSSQSASANMDKG